MRRAENFIAGRYLVAKRRVNFITVISYLSIGGVAVGVAALLLVLSVFNGFSELVTSFLVNFDPHLRVEARSADAFQELDALGARLAEDDAVVAFSPFAQGRALAQQAGVVSPVTLKGIDPKRGETTYGLRDAVALGAYDLTTDPGGTPKAIVGITLADRLTSFTGDTIVVVSTADVEKVIAQFAQPTSRRFVVAGVFNSNNNDYNSEYLFVSLEEATHLLGYEGYFQGYEARLENVERSESYGEKLRAELDPDLFAVSTWYDLHRQLYSVMQIERWSAYVLLTLVIAVAAFNILASMTMSVAEKRRDLGTLRALGMTRGGIVRTFMKEGLFVGAVGTALGYAIGLLVYFLQTTYNFYPLDPMKYRVDALPMALHMWDFLSVGFASISLTFLAALYPARRAASIDPLRAIRWE
ncbi:MAG: FtsX-like permease family protein [Ignavibacteriales bacterium]|nr:FtsX-like permease family protein [Ignavibacteriales bacterium]